MKPNEYLLNTSCVSYMSVYETEFEMFQRIFQRFLTEEMEISWEKIKPPGQSEVR